MCLVALVDREQTAHVRAWPELRDHPGWSTTPGGRPFYLNLDLSTVFMLVWRLLDRQEAAPEFCLFPL